MVERAFKGIWIPKEIWLDKELTVLEKIFLVEIDSLDNKDGCWASNKYFSEFFGVTKGRCTQIIKSLESKKFITIVLEREGKLITKRVIRVVNKLSTPSENIKQGYLENDEENNTSINNTKEVSSIPYSKIIAYLNEQTGKSYKAVGKNNDLIKARWNEGYSLEEFKRVIDNKVATWKGVTFQDGTSGDNYLRPATLFGTKFDGYLNETQPKKVSKMDGEGDEVSDKFKQYLERTRLATADSQQPTA